MRAQGPNAQCSLCSTAHGEYTHYTVISNHEYTQTIWCIFHSNSLLPRFEPGTPDRGQFVTSDKLNRTALGPY